MAEPARLSDEAWLAICAAAKLLPDADARDEIERCLLVEYPAFRYDAKSVKQAYERGLRMYKLCDQLVDLIGETSERADDIIRERNVYYIERLRRSAFAVVRGCEAIRSANRGRRDGQRDFLIFRLCGIWLDNFHAPDLRGGLTVPTWGGPPRGRLINYLMAAMRVIIPKSDLPSAEALRDAIERERQGRENVRQLVFDLRQRDNGVLKRKK